MRCREHLATEFAAARVLHVVSLAERSGLLDAPSRFPPQTPVRASRGVDVRGAWIVVSRDAIGVCDASGVGDAIGISDDDATGVADAIGVCGCNPSASCRPDLSVRVAVCDTLDSTDVSSATMLVGKMEST